MKQIGDKLKAYQEHLEKIDECLCAIKSHINAVVLLQKEIKSQKERTQNKEFCDLSSD